MRAFRFALHSLEIRYRRLFSIEEIEKESILQWAFGGLLFFFFVTFNRWLGSSNITIDQAERGNAVCWPYFPECSRFFFFHDIGVGYSQTVFYMALYALMTLIVYLMWRKRWTVAHAIMLVLLLWESAVVLLLSFSDGATYYYYHIVLTSTLLFARHKEFFLKLSFVFLYFMSATTKYDATWILGTYFTSLRDGLPLLPDKFIPLFTNLVIFMQTVGCWFLLSRNWLLQRLAFAYFAIFHVYSGIFVFYFYPSVSLPTLLIMFGPMYRHTPIPFSAKAAIGWLIIALAAVHQLLGFYAPGDRRVTLEGNRFGMFMFEANHQCIVTVATHLNAPQRNAPPDFEASLGTPCNSFYCLVKRATGVSDDGLTVRSERYESGTAWNRCYPYEWWARLHARCETRDNVQRIALTIDHSINGGAFYRTVDVADICSVGYRTFGPNTWIQEPPDAPLIGYPVTNTYN